MTKSFIAHLSGFYMNCRATGIITIKKKLLVWWRIAGVSQEKARPVQQPVKGHSSASTSFKINTNQNQKNTTWQKLILLSCMLYTMEMTRVYFPGQPSHSWRLISVAVPQITNKTHQHHHHLGISIYYAVKSNTIWILFLKINNFHFQNQYSSSLDSFMGNC